MTDKTTLLNALLARTTDEQVEGEILGLLRGASTAELNEMICGTKMHVLYDSVDDHPFGARNREALIQLLARDRRAELSVMSAAGVVYALQKGFTDRRDEEAIRDILLATHGEELTRLKNQINVRTDRYDLEGLVYASIDSGEIRQAILDHIAREAATVTGAASKIVSDIDDTTLSSIHDRLYPRGTIYPGILAFFSALDNGPDDEPISVGNLTFVTARPSDAFGLIENSTRDTLQRAGIAQAVVISGTFLSLFSHDAMAAQKMVNIRRYRELYPEYHQVFLGDSGQGDVLVAEQLWKDFPDAVLATFIHDVVDTPPEQRADYAARQIYFHDTYVGCATKAFELGLISRAGLERVVADARAGFDKVVFATPAQEASARALLDRDLAAVPG